MQINGQQPIQAYPENKSQSRNRATRGGDAEGSNGGGALNGDTGGHDYDIQQQ